MRSGKKADQRAGLPPLLLAILALSALFLAACRGEEPILIGFSGPLEGGYSDLGVQGRNGARLAVEEINDRGGVAGRDLDLLVADDSGAEEGPRRADKRLARSGVVAIIGHMTSSQTMRALSDPDRPGLVMVSPTTSTPELLGKADDFFRVISANTDWARNLGRHAGSLPDVRSIIVIADQDNSAYAAPFIQAFAKAFSELGGSVAGQVDFSSKAAEDVGALADQVPTDRVDGLLLVVSARDAAAIIRALRERDVDVEIFIAPWAYTKELVALGGSWVNGVIASMDYSDDIDRPEFRSFKRRFRDRFGREPSFAAVFSYEAVLVLAKALEATSGQARGLRAALAEVREVNGLLGTISMDKFGDVHRPSFILTVRQGELVSIPQGGDE